MDPCPQLIHSAPKAVGLFVDGSLGVGAVTQSCHVSADPLVSLAPVHSDWDLA